MPPTSTPRRVAMGRDSTASFRRCLVLTPRSLQFDCGWTTFPEMATVSNVADALAALGGSHVAGPLTGEAIKVALVEQPAALAALPPGTVALLTLRASAEATGYRLDLALRRAGDAAVAAVVLHGADKLPSTALRLAERAGLAVLLLPAHADGAEALLAADRALRPEPESALARLLAAHAAIERAGDASAETIVETAGRASGLSLHLSERGDETHVTLGALRPEIQPHRSSSSSSQTRSRECGAASGDGTSCARARGRSCWRSF